MKVLLIFALFTTSAFATSISIVFKENTLLPPILQQRILNEILSGIPCLQASSLKEVNTEIRVEQFGQEGYDYYYTTTFDLTYYFDRDHPSNGRITVRSARYSTHIPNEYFLVIQELPDFTRMCED